MNRITVIGRIVRDTELRAVGSREGTFVMNNTIAIPRAFKSESGQDTDFLNFVAWGKRAELIEEFCNKGDLIGLDGRIQSRTYQKESEQKVYIVEMNVESVYFLQGRRKKNVIQKSQPGSESDTESGIKNATTQTTRQAEDNQGNNQKPVSGTGLTIDNLETANS